MASMDAEQQRIRVGDQIQDTVQGTTGKVIQVGHFIIKTEDGVDHRAKDCVRQEGE